MEEKIGGQLLTITKGGIYNILTVKNKKVS